MEKVLLLEFNNNTPLQDIYEELIYYHNQGQLAETTYKEVNLSNKDNYKLITLSNKDIDKLKDTITRLELGLTEQEYEQYKKYEQKQHDQFKLYCARQNTPYIVRYWIERVSDTITSSKREEWEMYCYDLIKSAYETDNFQKEILKSYYKAIISASKIILALDTYDNNFDEDELRKVIDEEFSDISDYFEMNNKYLFIDSAVFKFTNFIELYQRLTYYRKVVDSYKYSNLPENNITKKRIPDYLRNKI